MSIFYVYTPSYFAQVVNGLFILVFLYILLSNYKSFIKTNYITQLQIIGFLTIAIGIHGFLHLGLEHIYNYNPLMIF